jgi:hypothetical protein
MPKLYKAVLIIAFCSALMSAALFNWIPNHSDRRSSATRPFSLRLKDTGVVYVSKPVGWLFDVSFYAFFVAVSLSVAMPYYYEWKGRAVREAAAKRDELIQLNLTNSVLGSNHNDTD